MRLRDNARALGAWLVLLAGTVLLAAGALLFVGSHGILDSDAFARRTASSLRDPRVAHWVGERITDGIISQRRDLTALRPVLSATVQGLVGSAPFEAIVRTGARQAHQAALSQGGEAVFLSLPDAGALVRSALNSISPEAAKKIPPRLVARLAQVGQTPAYRVALSGVAVLRKVVILERIALLLGPLLLVLSIAVATDRRQGLLRAGVACLAAAAVVAALLPLGHAVAAAVTREPDGRAALVGAWMSWFAGARLWAATFAGVGTILTAAATSLLEAVDPWQHLRTLSRRVLRPPRTAAGRAWAGAGLLAGGTLLMVWPQGALTGLVVASGLLMAYIGLRELFRLLLERVPEEAHPGAALEQAWGTRLAVAAGLAVVLGSTLVLVLRPSAPEPAQAATVMSCNGSPLLCDRRIEQVAFPAAHNAMSNTAASRWLFPHHEAAIPVMVREGVRGLLFDVHYGRPVGDVVKTAVDLEASSAEKIAQAIGEEGVAAALRIRDRLAGGDSGEAGLYFCHGYCELGAYPVVPTLRAIRDELLDHPGDVLLIVVEDYVTPQELARAFAESGLEELVYKGPAGPPWPTLRSLALAGQRVVVFIESGRAGVPWLHPTEGLIQETPYTFHAPEEFSCRPNRGGTTGGLFLLNHWIETTPAPRPSNAEKVNAYGVLLGRARRCMRERRHLPNLVAVDFYRTGDLLRVTNTLNGLPADTLPAADTARR